MDSDLIEFTRDQFIDLFMKIRLEKFVKGQSILRQGDLCNFKAYLVLSGTGASYKMASGFEEKQKISNYFENANHDLNNNPVEAFKEGEIQLLDNYMIDEKNVAYKKINEVQVGISFGEHGLVSDRRRNTTVIAKSDMECLVVIKEDFSYASGIVKRSLQNKIEFITAHMPIMNHIHSDVKKKDIIYNSQMLRMFSGQSLTKSGDKGEFIYLLKEGLVKVELKCHIEGPNRHQYGKNIHICDLTDGACIGEEILFQGVYKFNCTITSSNAIVFKIPKKCLSQLRSNTKKIMRDIYKEKLAHRMEKYNKQASYETDRIYSLQIDKKYREIDVYKESSYKKTKKVKQLKEITHRSFTEATPVYNDLSETLFKQQQDFSKENYLRLENYGLADRYHKYMSWNKMNANKKLIKLEHNFEVYNDFQNLGFKDKNKKQLNGIKKLRNTAKQRYRSLSQKRPAELDMTENEIQEEQNKSNINVGKASNSNGNIDLSFNKKYHPVKQIFQTEVDISAINMPDEATTNQEDQSYTKKSEIGAGGILSKDKLMINAPNHNHIALSHFFGNKAMAIPNPTKIGTLPTTIGGSTEETLHSDAIQTDQNYIFMKDSIDNSEDINQGDSVISEYTKNELAQELQRKQELEHLGQYHQKQQSDIKQIPDSSELYRIAKIPPKILNKPSWSVQQHNNKIIQVKKVHSSLKGPKKLAFFKHKFPIEQIPEITNSYTTFEDFKLDRNYYNIQPKIHQKKNLVPNELLHRKASIMFRDPKSFVALKKGDIIDPFNDPKLQAVIEKKILAKGAFKYRNSKSCPKRNSDMFHDRESFNIYSIDDKIGKGKIQREKAEKMKSLVESVKEANELNEIEQVMSMKSSGDTTLLAYSGQNGLQYSRKPSVFQQFEFERKSSLTREFAVDTDNCDDSLTQFNKTEDGCIISNNIQRVPGQVIKNQKYSANQKLQDDETRERVSSLEEKSLNTYNVIYHPILMTKKAFGYKGDNKQDIPISPHEYQLKKPEIHIQNTNSHNTLAQNLYEYAGIYNVIGESPAKYFFIS